MVPGPPPQFSFSSGARGFDHPEQEPNTASPLFSLGFMRISNLTWFLVIRFFFAPPPVGFSFPLALPVAPFLRFNVLFCCPPTSTGKSQLASIPLLDFQTWGPGRLHRVCASRVGVQYVRTDVLLPPEGGTTRPPDPYITPAHSPRQRRNTPQKGRHVSSLKVVLTLCFGCPRGFSPSPSSTRISRFVTETSPFHYASAAPPLPGTFFLVSLPLCTASFLCSDLLFPPVSASPPCSVVVAETSTCRGISPIITPSVKQHYL